MTKNQNTFYRIGIVILGIIGGIVGTAFSMGANNQRVNDTLTRHTLEMTSMREDDEAHEETTQKELDRFAEIIAAQMTLLQNGQTQLNDTIGNLRTDIQILKVLMERMERDLTAKVKSN